MTERELGRRTIMIARYASAATSGAIITFSLLLSMQALISLQPGAESDPRDRMSLAFIKLATPDSPVQRREDTIRKKDLVEPIITPPRARSSTEQETINLPRTAPLPPTEESRTTIGVFTDGPLVALVRVQPTYPARALSQGLEGYVVVRFDVSTDGHVINVAVVDSSHKVFEVAAVKAARKFRFKPRIVDGIPLETFGIQNLFRFELDKP